MLRVTRFDGSFTHPGVLKPRSPRILWAARHKQSDAGDLITAAWEAELLRVIELDPHEVGEETANWTTERLAKYLAQHTGIQVTEETVRVYLHAHDYVCKRPTWTLKRRAEEKVDYVGNACG